MSATEDQLQCINCYYFSYYSNLLQTGERFISNRNSCSHYKSNQGILIVRLHYSEYANFRASCAFMLSRLFVPSCYVPSCPTYLTCRTWSVCLTCPACLTYPSALRVLVLYSPCVPYMP